VLRANSIEPTFLAIGRIRKRAGRNLSSSVEELQDADELLLAWKETPDLDPAVVKSAYLSAFEAVYGKLPFANRRR
jgi:hypothetical protein